MVAHIQQFRPTEYGRQVIVKNAFSTVQMKLLKLEHFLWKIRSEVLFAERFRQSIHSMAGIKRKRTDFSTC